MYIDVLFVLLYMLFPVLFIYLLKKSGNSVLKLSVPGFFIVSYFIFSYLGYLHLYFGLDAYRVQVGVVDKYVIIKSALFSIYSLSTFSVGWLLCLKSVGVRHSAPSNLDSIRKLNNGELFWLFALALVVLAVLIVYVSQIPKLALFVALSDSVSDAKLARSDMGNNFSGKYHWYSLFIHEISSLVTFTFLSAWLVTKRKVLGVLFALSFLQTFFAAIMATQKGPIMWLLIGVFCTYTLSKNRGLIKSKQLLYLGAIGLGLVLIIDMLFMGSGDSMKALWSVFSRTLSGGISPSYFYLEYFPSHESYLLGRSFPNPGGLLPFEPYHLTIEMANWAFPHLVKTGIVSTMPAVFWGEIYANFGVPGILILPFCIGFILSLFVFLVNKLKTTPLTIGLSVWLMMHYKDLSITGISSFVFDVRMFCVMGLVLLIISTSNRFKLELNRVPAVTGKNYKEVAC